MHGNYCVSVDSIDNAPGFTGVLSLIVKIMRMATTVLVLIV